MVERAFVRLHAESAVTNTENAEVARSAIAVFEEGGSELGLARAWGLLSQVHVAECRFGEATGMLERALAHAERARDQREEDETAFRLGVALGWGPAPAEATIARGDAMLGRFAGHPTVEAGVLYLLAFSHARRGRFEQARELCARARATLEDLGLSVKVAASTQVSGMVELLAGQPAAAERQLREGYDALAEGGGSQLLPTSAALLAEALLAQERDEEAERFAAVTEATASPDDLDAQIRWRNVRSRLLARAGRAEEAETTARTAVELAARTDSIELRGDAELALAEALEAAGRPEDAAAACREAQALYEAKGNVVSAERAREALRGLAGAAP
jgi:tetratricopeptide (TPR) repeat protein